MEPRLSLVTLGVANLTRSRTFYEAMGFSTDADPEDDVVFFQIGAVVLGLWDRERLAEDSGVRNTPGWGGVTLAHNVRSPEEVRAVIAEARRAGAEVTKDPGATFWGGYSGAFLDPDGHPWEVAHNPFWTIEDDGSVRLG